MKTLIADIPMTRRSLPPLSREHKALKEKERAKARAKEKVKVPKRLGW